MSYGVQVMTSTGQMSSDTLNTYGIVKILHCQTETGSATIPEFNSDVGFWHLVIGDSVFEQAVAWNNTTKSFVWIRDAAFGGRVHSSNFYVYFFRGVSA
ncbi:hypothetical protein [Pseudogemmobacter bohemicus]|uniref:hypothetical protein n=1 Tax=Pseudogemmobacter bohemicus TaxID=2250708 RepID=UPI00130046B7|nr:hypothetical protein [Pseudogemmobacter bohemicus]